ncbi:hypothetical protein M406DRAFT_330540 [Cryphonectria parasitica EP155]|uniref:Zn(2)-C6 fungal-type domain-containing protein n=1 Tax=Cryphonectria parasitica (strain ATCC 38755 / EP155) TaxID=660469 RepID=A0A9P4Y0C4_CRYP1|nr:uncharacterized protein M406DRAFT_330540 [Cryphonectria parasitica EP155]KAF3764189.1 hypothetical protein M406DRAFT_330540 [Cryphonectria parasitica EP155]
MDEIETSTSVSDKPARRRNGRLQACEPCRRRKVSCDHAYPVCRRCRARSNADSCVYLAPQQTPPGSRKPTPRRLSEVAGARRQSNGPLPPQSIHNGISSTVNPLPDPTEARGLPSETSPGYLGFTSFSAVYQETQNSLSLVQGATILSQMRTPSSSDAAESSRTSANLTPRTLETCLAVLRRIPGHDVSLSLYNKHRNPNDGWVRLAGQRLARSLHEAFDKELRSRKASDLESMAQVISNNTAKLWSEDEPDPDKWITSFSGRNMRWECIGILFTYWGLAALADHAHRPEPGRTLDAVDPRRMTLVYQHAAQLCIDLCKGCAPNSLLLYLMYKVAILESMLSGDASPSFWGKYGEVVATATYLGLHAMPHDSTYMPTASSEARRRLISQIFVVDKVGASFCGRPPLMSRKYLLTPLPLDMSDEVLLSSPEEIAREVQRLDEQGWNRNGDHYSTTIMRARRLLMTVKEEVMELAMGPPMSASIEALLDLNMRQLALISDLPGTLQYRSEDVRNHNVSGPVLYTKVLVHLENLQNLFFIDRMLVQRGHASHADLLSVSFEMVATTLVFWTHMDRLAGDLVN